MAKKIVVLGGGYAGVLTAKCLAKNIKKRGMNDVEVTLIDKNTYNTMLTELHEVAANRVEHTSIKMDLKKIFEGRKVDIVLDNITKMDFENSTLNGTKQNYKYDYLVVASGSKPTYFGIEGASDNAFPLWSYDDAVTLRHHIEDMFRLADNELDPALRKQMLTFFVVGAGFTGVEMVGELAEWMPELLAEYNLKPVDVVINLVDMLPRVVPNLPESLSAKAHNRLVKLGVNVKLGNGVVGVGKDYIRTKKDDVVTETKTNTVIWAAGVEGSTVAATSTTTVARGRIETNEYLQAKVSDNVYVAGDNIFYIPEGEKMAVPQMVENAEASSHLAAMNILSDIQGKPQEKHAYKPQFHGMMVCIGGRYGVAYVGSHTKKYALPSFLAMFAKHFINIIYFLQVLGWNKIWHYLCQEVFAVRHNRSFVGGHFANGGPAFWKLPLRLFVGLSWFLSGMEKLPKIMTDFNKIFLFKIPGADATSGASEAAATTATAVAQVPKEFFAKLGYYLLPHGDAALPVPHFMTTMVDAVMVTLVKPIAPEFQAFMIFAELIIGLCLLGGLFTSCAGLAGAVLCAMIYTSGMSDASILWFMLGSLAMVSIGGSGQVFALDYYVMPALKKWWSGLPFVKKLYIYND